MNSSNFEMPINQFVSSNEVKEKKDIRFRERLHQCPRIINCHVVISSEKPAQTVMSGFSLSH